MVCKPWRLSAILDLRYLLRSATIQNDVLSGTVSTVLMSARRLMGLVGGFNSLELEPLSVCGGRQGGPWGRGLDLGRRSRLSMLSHVTAKGGRFTIPGGTLGARLFRSHLRQSPPAMRASHLASPLSGCALALRSHLPACARSSAPSFRSIHSWSSGLSRNYL